MELFKIACPSCATRLKVSQASAIGQILACPKCGSMVEVVPPEGWQLPPELANPPAKKQAPPAPRIRDDSLPETASKPFEDFDDIESLLTGNGQGPTGTQTKGASRGKPGTRPSSFQGSVAPAIQSSSKSPPPPAAWSQSGATLQRKKFALQVGAVVTLALVAVALIVVLMSTLFKPDPDSIATNAGSKANAARTPPKNNGTTATDPKGENTPKNDSQPATNGTGASTLTAKGMYAPRLDVPPMSLPAETTAPTVPPGFEVTPPATAKSPTGGLIEQFGDLNQVLDGSEAFSLQELADATGAQRGQIGIGTIFVRKPSFIEIDVPQRLQQPIAQVAFPDVSLIDAIRTLTNISLIPICYEVELIEVEGIDLSAKVTLQLADTTVGATLDALLKPSGLAAVAQDGFILITTADRDEWTSREVDLSVLQLDDPAMAERFAEFLQSAFAKASWSSAGGQGTIQVDGVKLTIHQTGPVHALIEQLVGKLAAAKTLVQDPADEAALTALQSRRTKSQTARQAGVSLKLLAEKNLETVLSQIAADLGTDVVVNWQALLPEGWTPQTEIPWESDGEPLEQKLRDLTDSMNLTTRVINGHTMQITTHADAERQLELEVYPCAELLQKYSTEQLTKIFESVLGSQVDPRAGMSVTLESTSQCWVAILPQPLQFRFESGLNQLRKEIAATKK